MFSTFVPIALRVSNKARITTLCDYIYIFIYLYNGNRPFWLEIKIIIILILIILKTTTNNIIIITVSY